MFPNADLLATTDLLQETLGLFPFPLTPSSCAGDAPLQPSFSVVFVSVMETDTSSMTAARIFFFFLFSQINYLPSKINNSSCQWMQAGENSGSTELLRPKLEKEN